MVVGNKDKWGRKEEKEGRGFGKLPSFCFSTFLLDSLTKVLDWNSFRTNQPISRHSGICFRIIPSNSEPIWKNVFYLIWQKTVKNQSDSIQGINPNEFESIRINRNHSDLGFIRIDSNWKFVLYWYLGWNRIQSDWLLTVLCQIRYKTFFRLVRNDSK